MNYSLDLKIRKRLKVRDIFYSSRRRMLSHLMSAVSFTDLGSLCSNSTVRIVSLLLDIYSHKIVSFLLYCNSRHIDFHKPFFCKL